MQFQVGSGAAAPAFDLPTLQTELPKTYAKTQPAPLVPSTRV